MPPRSLSVEVRSEVSGNKVVGHAAVFGQLADLGGNGWEALGRTAFDQALKAKQDVRALVNHDPNQLLARSGNGSLRLAVDNEGLAFEMDLPDTTLGRDVREMVANGLLNQMSFGFVPGKFDRSEAPDGRQVRTHTSVAELRDVSLVAYPAYDGTSAELRHVEFPPTQKEEHRMTLEDMLAALRELMAAAEAEGDTPPDPEAADERNAKIATLNAQIEAKKKVAENRAAAKALLEPVPCRLHVLTAATGTDEMEERFEHAIRYQDMGALAEFRAQSEGVGSAGGYLVPPSFRNKLVEKMKEYGGFSTIAESFSTGSGEPVEWTTMDDTSNLGAIVAEGAQIPAVGSGADLVFGTKTLGAYKYGSGGAGDLPLKVSLELLQDNKYDLRGKLAGWMGTRIARKQAVHWLTGTGVSEPEGLLPPKTGFANIASTTTPTVEELIDTVHALDPAYRDGSVWVMNDTTLKILRKLKDGDSRPLLQNHDSSIEGGMGGSSLLGYRVVIDQAMPSIAASGATKFIAFGRMNDAYVIRRVANFQLVVLNELYAVNGQVGFLGWERADGCVQDANAYVVLLSKA